MLSIRPQQKIVEKILATRGGGKVRVTFLVVETAGNIEFKVVSVTPVVALEAKKTTLCLPGTVATSVVLPVFSKIEKVISPYTALFFFNSQPTRAPAQK